MLREICDNAKLITQITLIVLFAEDFTLHLIWDLL